MSEDQFTDQPIYSPFNQLEQKAMSEELASFVGNLTLQQLEVIARLTAEEAADLPSLVSRVLENRNAASQHAETVNDRLFAVCSQLREVTSDGNTGTNNPILGLALYDNEAKSQIKTTTPWLLHIVNALYKLSKGLTNCPESLRPMFTKPIERLLTIRERLNEGDAQSLIAVYDNCERRNTDEFGVDYSFSRITLAIKNISESKWAVKILDHIISYLRTGEYPELEKQEPLKGI